GSGRRRSPEAKLFLPSGLVERHSKGVVTRPAVGEPDRSLVRVLRSLEDRFAICQANELQDHRPLLVLATDQRGVEVAEAQPKSTLVLADGEHLEYPYLAARDVPPHAHHRVADRCGPDLLRQVAADVV